MVTIVLITANKLKSFSNIFILTFSILIVIIAGYFCYHLSFAHSSTDLHMKVMNSCSEIVKSFIYYLANSSTLENEKVVSSPLAAEYAAAQDMTLVIVVWRFKAQQILFCWVWT